MHTLHNQRCNYFKLLMLLAIAASLGQFSAPITFGQDHVGTIQVRVMTDHADWLYQSGQNVKFKISVIQDGHQIPNAQVNYKIGPEMMPPTIEKTVAVPADGLIIDGGTLKESGFLRCIATYQVGGRTYRGLATAGFSPEQIKPTQTDPQDFDEFWNKGKEALSKLPVDAKLTFLPDYSTPNVNVYHVSIQNVGGSGQGLPSRLYGILCEPKAEGKYPAVLSVPGAGIRPYRGMMALAEKGIITFQIGIHGLPVILDQSVYDSLGRSAVANYWNFNLDNRDNYYYRRVYLGCIRANDFIFSLPKFDGKNLAVTGGSQGGALSIVTAALDTRVKALAAVHPAISDVTGYLHNRAGGWPHMFRDSSNRTKEKLETMTYYDVVNFARRIKVPGFYTWGFNDETCPPTSMYSAYNSITAKKELVLALETGHFILPEQTDRINNWLESFLKTGQ